MVPVRAMVYYPRNLALAEDGQFRVALLVLTVYGPLPEQSPF